MSLRVGRRDGEGVGVRAGELRHLAEHTGPVWDVAYHDCGDFVVSASMDQCAKLWDVVTGKAKQAFRGHVDSVNSVCFQPFSNTIATGSGDKTVSLWDCRWSALRARVTTATRTH